MYINGPWQPALVLDLCILLEPQLMELFKMTIWNWLVFLHDRNCGHSAQLFSNSDLTEVWCIAMLAYFLVGSYIIAIILHPLESYWCLVLFELLLIFQPDEFQQLPPLPPCEIKARTWFCDASKQHFQSQYHVLLVALKWLVQLHPNQLDSQTTRTSKAQRSIDRWHWRTIYIYINRSL